MKKETAINKALEFANEKYGGKRKVKYVYCGDQELIEDDEIFYIPFKEEKVANRKIWVGAYKGVIIDKSTGELFQPGSIYELEKWIWGFKLGFRGRRLDFTICQINDERRAIELIERLGIQYVIPELENGTIWKIPRTYNHQEIKKRISKLPCTFKNQGLTLALKTIEEIVNSDSFEFEVKPVKLEIEGIYGELLDENNLMK